MFFIAMIVKRCLRNSMILIMKVYVENTLFNKDGHVAPHTE